jgi:hypothetical protein
VLLDWSGALFHHTHDLTIEGDEDDPPAVGILHSRLDKTVTGDLIRSVGQCNWQRVNTDGAFDVAGVYILRAEVQYWERCFIANDSGKYCVIHTQSNDDSVVSPNCTISDDTDEGTNTHVHWKHCNFNHREASPSAGYACVYLKSVQNASFDSCLFHDEGETGPLIRIGNAQTRPSQIQVFNSVMHDAYLYAVLFEDGVICDDFVFVGNKTQSEGTADIASEGTVILDRPRIECSKVDLSSGSSRIRNGGYISICEQGKTGLLSVANFIACRVEARQTDTLTLPSSPNNLADIYYVD